MALKASMEVRANNMWWYSEKKKEREGNLVDSCKRKQIAALNSC